MLNKHSQPTQCSTGHNKPAIVSASTQHSQQEGLRPPSYYSDTKRVCDLALAKAKESSAEGVAEVQAVEDASGEGGGAEASTATASGSTKVHPAPPKLNRFVKTAGKGKRAAAAQKVAAITDEALIAGRSWINLTEEDQ